MTTSLTMPDVLRSPPPGDQIAAYYRDQIRSGERKVGDRLPAIRALVAEWQVSTHTVQRALRILREEGLIEVKRGPQPPRVIAVPK